MPLSECGRKDPPTFKKKSSSPTSIESRGKNSKFPKEVKETPSALHASEESIFQPILLWWWLDNTQHVEEKRKEKKLESKRKRKSPKSDSNLVRGKRKITHRSIQHENPKTVNTALDPCGCKPTGDGACETGMIQG